MVHHIGYLIINEGQMKYLSTKEASQRWGIGQRRIQILCANDRIPGASLVGNTWIIPEDAEKPKDGRVKTGKYIKTTSSYER